MVAGILVTHGSLGDELLRTAGLIIGDVAHCVAVSNEGKTPKAVCAEIESVIESLDGIPCMVFIDFVGGSCSFATLSVERTDGGLSILSGVNLPMILAFLNKRDKVSFEELPDTVLERSQESLQILDPSKI